MWGDRMTLSMALAFRATQSQQQSAVTNSCLRVAELIRYDLQSVPWPSYLVLHMPVVELHTHLNTPLLDTTWALSDLVCVRKTSQRICFIGFM